MNLVSKALIVVLWLVGTLASGPTLQWSDACREAEANQTSIRAAGLHFIVEETQVTLRFDVPMGTHRLLLAAPVPAFIVTPPSGGGVGDQPGAIRLADRGADP